MKVYSNNPIPFETAPIATGSGSRNPAPGTGVWYIVKSRPERTPALRPVLPAPYGADSFKRGTVGSFGNILKRAALVAERAKTS